MKQSERNGKEDGLLCLITNTPSFFYSGPNKNKAKNILNLSRSNLTKLISIITGFNCVSNIQFKADPTINPLCRLCGEENETFWHLATECPRLKMYREEVFLDKYPEQENWGTYKLSH